MSYLPRIEHRRFILSAFVALCLFAPLSAFAETSDYGGWSESFRAGGDQTPPECQITIPRASTEPFFIQWNCVDDVSPKKDIRSELWVLRQGAPAATKITEFLGFPASVLIDEGVLQTEAFTDGLPAGFRLIARDRAGVAVITPYLTVRAQDNSLSLCTLTIATEATESTGDTTGIPALSVIAEDAEVITQQLGTDSFRVGTLDKANADPCEVDSVCSNGSQITFESAITLESGTETSGAQAANGTISISPGSVLAEVAGSAEIADASLTELNVTGVTTIDGQDASVTLICQP